MRRSVAFVFVAFALAGGTALAVRAAEDPFPHAEHAGLFPTCLACHQGVSAGDSSAFYTVRPEECARCHDGERLERVEWRGPAPRPSVVVFSHPSHAEEVQAYGESALTCGACHAAPGVTARMAVGAATPSGCLGCHAHRAEAHLVDADCSTCHAPVARAAGLSAERIGSFPAPEGHERERFLLDHAEAARAADARCAFCHARESCARCHLNAGDVEAIAGLESDERVASLLTGEPGEWPEPPGHEDEDWWRVHGDAARAGIASCANCHAADSCTGCHGDAPPRVVSRLPRPGPGAPSGVRVDVVRPPGHDADFVREHGTAAAAALPSCGSCHGEADCARCHEPGGVGTSMGPVGSGPAGPGGERELRRSATWAHGGGVAAPADTTEEEDREPRRDWPFDLDAGFHPADFVLRHGAEAFAAREECAECHNREAYCRSCHESLGMAASSRQTTGGAFHDAQADWLISHGRAARQNLEACAGCHRQSSCLRCHSARSGLRVSPHGPGFDPDRVADRSLASCGICHFREQVAPP